MLHLKLWAALTLTASLVRVSQHPTGSSVAEQGPSPRPISLDRAVGIALKGLDADSALLDEQYQLSARQDNDAWVLTFVFDDEKVTVARVDKAGVLTIASPASAAYSVPPPHTQSVPFEDAVRIALDKLRSEDLMHGDRFRLLADQEIDGTWSLMFEWVPLSPDLYITVFVREDGTADYGAR